MLKRLKHWILSHKKRTLIFSILIVLTFIISLTYSFAANNPVKSITITSKNTNYENNESGSWQVIKSAEWLQKGKATVTLDVDTTAQTSYKNTDIIFVLDISGSMSGEKINRVKQDTKELLEKQLSTADNRAALITFDSNSNIISDLTNDKYTLINKIDQLRAGSATNYYQALVNVDTILQDYTKEEDREVIVLFLTDGYPNVDIPNQIAQYKYLKDLYPYITINGIQYEMGNTILTPIKQISDNQYMADMETLNNVLFDASIKTSDYDRFEIVDYVDNRYFDLESADDITVSAGEVKLEEENGTQKITWTIPSLNSGKDAKLTMNLKLKDEYIDQGGVYSTNEKTQVISKLEEQEEDVTSTQTPALANNYKVIYDGNAPDGCNVTNIPSTETKYVFDTVSISDVKPTCGDYQFKGWEIATDKVTKVNDDYFIMPESDVTIRAKWSKADLSKSMNGTSAVLPLFYSIIEDQAVMDNTASSYVSSSNGIDFSKISSYTNGNGVYTRAGTENDEYPVHYYRGNVTNNNVKFAGFCWKAVRTTSTGGVKLIYNGTLDDNGTCVKSEYDRITIGEVYYNTSASSPADVGYMYGTRHTVTNKNISWYDIVGKEAEYLTSMRSTNYYYADSVTYSNGTYTLNNPTQYLWSANYSNLVGKYTCSSETDTKCTSVSYVISSNSSRMNYVAMNNGETYDSLYTQANNLNWVYGNDVTWNGSRYTLVDTIESKPAEMANDKSTLAEKYHYTCLSSNNSCTTVYYIHTYGESTISYFTLEQGKKIDTLRQEMMTNTNDSVIKETIDTWYENNLLDYAEYLEDTVWCNDRSIVSGSLAGKDTTATDNTIFGPYERKTTTHNPIVTCPNKNDAFTVGSELGNGDLTYPIATLTIDEVNMAGEAGANSNYYLFTSNNWTSFWWTISPIHIYNSGASSNGYYLYYDAGAEYVSVNSTRNVRPAISLNHDIVVVNGTGTNSNPYEVDFP